MDDIAARALPVLPQPMHWCWHLLTAWCAGIRMRFISKIEKIPQSFHYTAR